MTNNQLLQYRGSLRPEDIANGINAAASNAKRLSDDAKLLFDSKRYPSAVSLAILAIEESGKAQILRSLALARDEKEIRAGWKDYRSHRSKNPMWIFPQLVAEGARSLEDFRPIFDPESDHPVILDQLKQIGFYTDCLGKKHWSIPEEVIDEKLAANLVSTASLLADKKSVSVQEIELWKKHIGPVWKLDMDRMKTALSNWATEMHKMGLMDESDSKFHEFIDGANDPDLRES